MEVTPGSTSSDASGNGVRARPPTPRWVKALAALGAVAVVLLVAALLFGGEHGPQRHGSQGALSVPAAGLWT